MHASNTARRPQHDPEAFNRKIRHAVSFGAGSRKRVKAENARMMRRFVRRALKGDPDAV